MKFYFQHFFEILVFWERTLGTFYVIKIFFYFCRALTCFDLKSIFNSSFQVLKGCQKKWNFTGFFKNHYSCHRFVVITVPKVLFDKTLKFLLVMRGNSSHFQALSWKLYRVPRVYTDLISGVSPAIFKILPEIPWDYLQGRPYIDWQTIGIGSDHVCDDPSSVTLSPAPLITATYGIAIY